MLEISSKTNLLEQKSYKYSLQDVTEPNLQRDIYAYGSVPKVSFNHRRVPLNMPEEIGAIIEWGGPGIDSLSVPERATITNMETELGATTSIFPSDNVTREFLTMQGRENDFIPLTADLDAKYDRIIEINLS